MEGTFPKARFPLLDSPPPGNIAITAVSGPTIEGHDAICQVTFDTTPGQPLADVSACDASKWMLTWSSTQYAGSSIAAIDFNTIEVTFTDFSTSLEFNHVSYTNAPSDVFDSVGNSLPATDWPL